MGLFGRKAKIPDGIRVMFYEGDLTGFGCNLGAQLLLMDDVLRITRINPYIEVRLDRNRITAIDIMPEKQYMLKYKGEAIETSKMKSISIDYYVIHYISKDGQNKHLDFSGTASESLKIMKMRKELMANRGPSSYSI